MAYDTNELIKKSLALIKSNPHGVHFFQDVFVGIGIARQTFYTHELDQVDEIRDGLEKNRTATKQVLREKWLTSDNPTLEIALMRLLSTSEEHKKLNQKYLEHSGDQENPISLSNLSEKDLSDLRELVAKASQPGSDRPGNEPKKTKKPK